MNNDKIQAAEWPAMKKAIWDVITGEKLNTKYVNARELTDKIYAQLEPKAVDVKNNPENEHGINLCSGGEPAQETKPVSGGDALEALDWIQENYAHTLPTEYVDKKCETIRQALTSQQGCARDDTCKYCKTGYYDKDTSICVSCGDQDDPPVNGKD